jgi:hypothetical protein
MPPHDRDFYCNQIINELSLSDHHKQALLKRGFTEEQIAKDGYRSVPRYYKPLIELPKNFPGLRQDGTLCISNSGILIPNRNHEGLIISFSIASDDRSKGKYKPVSISINQYHINAEPPVFSILPEVESGYILLCEGNGFKGILASHKLNLPVVTAPAGQYASSPTNSQTELAHASEKYQTKLLVITPDAGDITNHSRFAHFLGS